MEARNAPSFLPLIIAVLALLLASTGCASRDAPGPREMMVVTPQDDSKCEVMAPCGRGNCCAYCRSIGLMGNAFCTFKPDFQFYCCCIILAPRQALLLPTPAVTGSEIQIDSLKCNL
ncbi:hypothetical protein QOZ80_2BG0205510 [Eleusine coracana subsp. coracana]|nr:hypothetical protein QOZ80_2BG0205510 [Eleusine coracana subsp. coracana]